MASFLVVIVWLMLIAVDSQQTFESQRANFLYGLYQLGSTELETPIAVHTAHGISVSFPMCLAYYNDVALDILTLERPIINTPTTMHNTNSRVLCMGYARAILGNFFFAPLNEPNGEHKVETVLTPLFEQLGYDDISFNVDPDILNCNKDIECLNNVSLTNGYSERIIASIIAQDIIDEFADDGWNMHGLLTTIDDKTGFCEANCKPYSDHTGYKPKNNPWNKNNKNKYDKYWQPLLESDTRGFFYRHEHVTPHIGITGKLYLLDKYVMADEPDYDYNVEGDDVISRLAVLAESDYQKVAVEFFDNKLNIRGLLWNHIMATYEELATAEIMVLFTAGISFAEHEAVLQAWNQKVYYDRVRPTTVIQKWGNRKITTYGGPYQGLKTIKAKYFEPYIRVMPHSEYPSGSACICTAYQEFTDLFIKEYFDDDSLFNMNVSIKTGSSKIETGITPKEDIIIHMDDMKELAYICGESRLWGGMHFRKSVDESNRICHGIGIKAFQLVQKVNNNAAWD